MEIVLLLTFAENQCIKTSLPIASADNYFADKEDTTNKDKLYKVQGALNCRITGLVIRKLVFEIIRNIFVLYG